jgi:hypothetical protein
MTPDDDTSEAMPSADLHTPVPGGGEVPAARRHAVSPNNQRPPVAHGLQMKLRNPLAAWLGLPLITLGIYHYVWYYKIHHVSPNDGRPPVAHGLQMKLRNPLAAWLGLPLITLGIYHYVWYYKIHHEMGEFDRRRSVPAVGPMLVLIFLSWTIIAPLVSYFGCGKRIANAQRAAGLPVTCSPGVGVLLMILLGVGVFYYQAELNKITRSYGSSTSAGHQVPLFV